MQNGVKGTVKMVGKGQTGKWSEKNLKQIERDRKIEGTDRKGKGKKNGEKGTENGVKGTGKRSERDWKID